MSTTQSVSSESAIDALSLAAIEGCDTATAYLSTGGGWGDAGRDALMRRLTAPRRIGVAYRVRRVVQCPEWRQAELGDQLAALSQRSQSLSPG